MEPAAPGTVVEKLDGQRNSFAKPQGASCAFRQDAVEQFLEILVIALCTLICGGEGWEDMTEFGHAKEPFFREQLGLSLPHSALAPSGQRVWLDLATRSARALLRLERDRVTVGKVLTDKAIHNAMVVHAAFGGSTNLLLHVPAIAYHAGLRRPTVEDWIHINRLLVPFGKHICTGTLPQCSTCPVLEMCRQVGVNHHR